MYLAEYTGRGVRVAVVDSGIHSAHPHVNGVAEGVAIREDGTRDEDFVDRIGHGTAVAAAIREKAPDVELVAIKIFRETLAANIGTLVAGIVEACERRARVVNLSLGTADARHGDALTEAVGLAVDRGMLVIAAAEDRGVRWLPGSLTGVVPVHLDWEIPREAYAMVEGESGLALRASGYPREIPGVPRERNLKGVSFAVANATGFVARACEALPHAGLTDVLELLRTASR